jgi:hypothetical protein
MFPFLDEKRSRIFAGKIKKIDTAYRQTAANERDEYITEYPETYGRSGYRKDCERELRRMKKVVRTSCRAGQD